MKGQTQKNKKKNKPDGDGFAEMGLFWKGKIEKVYEELGQMEVLIFPPEEEKLEEEFRQLKIAKRDARREARRKASEASRKQKQVDESKQSNELADDDKWADKHDDDKPAELQAAAA